MVSLRYVKIVIKGWCYGLYTIIFSSLLRFETVHNYYCGDIYDDIKLRYAIARNSKIPVPKEQAYFPRQNSLLEGKKFIKRYWFGKSRTTCMKYFLNSSYSLFPMDYQPDLF